MSDRAVCPLRSDLGMYDLSGPLKFAVIPRHKMQVNKNIRSEAMPLQPL